MGFIQTRSGTHFDFQNFKPDDLIEEDIWWGLSHIPRFGGHTAAIYTVAQHSVLCSHIVPPGYALEALMHDAAEAYCGDVPSPLKALLPDYRKIELVVDTAIRCKWKLPPTMSELVKRADIVILATERRDVLGDDGAHWPVLEGVEPLPEKITPACPDRAYRMFMDRYNELMEGRVCV
jgi:hypothetical protein